MTEEDKILLGIGLLNDMYNENDSTNLLDTAKYLKNANQQSEWQKYLNDQQMNEKEEALAESKRKEEVSRKSEIDKAAEEYVSLEKDLYSSKNPYEVEIIKQKMSTLKNQFPELNNTFDYKMENLRKQQAKYDDDESKKKVKEVAIYQNFLGTLPDIVKDSAERNKLIVYVDGLDISEDLKNKLKEHINNISSTSKKVDEANQNAVAAEAGKKTGKKIADNNLKKDVEDAVKNNTRPSELSSDIRPEVIKNYNWNITTLKWDKK